MRNHIIQITNYTTSRLGAHRAVKQDKLMTIAVQNVLIIVSILDIYSHNFVIIKIIIIIVIIIIIIIYTLQPPGYSCNDRDSHGCCQRRGQRGCCRLLHLATVVGVPRCWLVVVAQVTLAAVLTQVADRLAGEIDRARATSYLLLRHASDHHRWVRGAIAGKQGLVGDTRWGQRSGRWRWWWWRRWYWETRHCCDTGCHAVRHLQSNLPALSPALSTIIDLYQQHVTSACVMFTKLFLTIVYFWVHKQVSITTKDCYYHRHCLSP